MDHIPVITIDGPSGAGKGTVAIMLSKELKWNILDSGALYRTLAFVLQERQIDLENFNSEKDTTKHSSRRNSNHDLHCRQEKWL